MKKFVAAAFAACAAMLALTPAFAAEGREEPKTLEKVVVTAGRIEEKAKNVTQAMTIVPREEIEKNQYQDLGQMLRNYGLQVDSNTTNEVYPGRFAIRGMRANLSDAQQSPVLILIDGRRTGTANVSMIPMVSIERVEILRGPASVQYGGSAVAGVVNVITKRGGEDLRMSAEAGYGSWETWRTQAGVSGSGGPVDFAGGLSWATSGADYKTGDGDRYRNTHLNHRMSYVLNGGWNFLDEHRLGLSFVGTEVDRTGSPDDFRQNAITPKMDRSNHSYDATYDGGYKDFGLSWKARYFQAKDHYARYNDTYTFMGVTYPSPDYDIYTNTRGAQGQVSWNVSFLTLTAGLDWMNNQYWVNSAYSRSDKNESVNTGGFLLAKAGLFDEMLILSAGVRYDDFAFKYIDRAEKNLAHVSPSVGLAWHALDWLTFRANYGESYQTPTAMQVTGYTQGTTVNYRGNPDLDPEKGRGWDAGLEVNYNTINFGLTYFEIDYKDKIQPLPVAGTSDLQYRNIGGKTKYRGLEGQASVDVGEFFDWSFKLRPYVNLTRMIKYEDPSGNALDYVRKIDLAYGLNFQYPSLGLEADLRLIYFGHQTEQDFNAPGYPKVRTGGETTVDFFVSKTLADWEKWGKLSAKAEARNILNRNYATSLGYTMPGRSFYLGLRYDY